MLSLRPRTLQWVASLEDMWYGLFVETTQYPIPERILFGNGLTVLQAQLGDWDNLNHLLVCEESGVACIVDPFCGKYWVEVCNENKWLLESCVLTHSHWDHSKGVKELLALQPECRIWLHQNEEERGWGGPDTDHWTHHANSAVSYSVGQLDFSIHLTPGHTPGHITMSGNGVVISGDCLFLGRCGRVDLLGGNIKSQFESLGYLKKVLNELPKDWLILPGHQYLLANGETPTTSTVDELLNTNEALRSAGDWDEFKQLKFLSFNDSLAEKARRQKANN